MKLLHTMSGGNIASAATGGHALNLPSIITVLLVFVIESAAASVISPQTRHASAAFSFGCKPATNARGRKHW
jgi:hypothetical protein